MRRWVRRQESMAEMRRAGKRRRGRGGRSMRMRKQKQVRASVDRVGAGVPGRATTARQAMKEWLGGRRRRTTERRAVRSAAGAIKIVRVCLCRLSPVLLPLVLSLQFPPPPLRGSAIDRPSAVHGCLFLCGGEGKRRRAEQRSRRGGARGRGASYNGSRVNTGPRRRGRAAFMHEKGWRCIVLLAGGPGGVMGVSNCGFEGAGGSKGQWGKSQDDASATGVSSVRVRVWVAVREAR